MRCASGAWRSMHCWPQAPPSERIVEVLKVCIGGRVLLVADGAIVATPQGDDRGWGQLVAHDRAVVATAHNGVSIASSSPCAAKWGGKLNAWDLTAALGVLPSEVR